VNAVGPVDAQIITVVSIERLRIDTAPGDKLCLHAANSDIQSITSEPVQKQGINCDLAVIQTRQGWKIWLKNEVRITTFGRTNAGQTNDSAKSVGDSPG
jgi:hypothetical protein